MPSKTEIVRAAFDKLGPDVKFGEVKAYAREHFNEDVPQSVFYLERKRLAEPRKPEAAMPADPPPPPPSPSPPSGVATPPSPPPGRTVSVEEVAEVVTVLKYAVGLLGKEQTKRLVDLL